MFRLKIHLNHLPQNCVFFFFFPAKARRRKCACKECGDRCNKKKSWGVLKGGMLLLAQIGRLAARGPPTERESSHMSNVRRGMEEKKFLRLKPTRLTFPTQVVVGLVRRGTDDGKRP